MVWERWLREFLRIEKLKLKNKFKFSKPKNYLEIKKIRRQISTVMTIIKKNWYLFHKKFFWCCLKELLICCKLISSWLASFSSLLDNVIAKFNGSGFIAIRIVLIICCVVAISLYRFSLSIVSGESSSLIWLNSPSLFMRCTSIVETYFSNSRLSLRMDTGFVSFTLRFLPKLCSYQRSCK